MPSTIGSLQSAFSQRTQVYSLQQSHEFVSIIVPIWQVRKLRPGVVKRLPVIIAAKKQPSWDVNPVLLYVFTSVLESQDYPIRTVRAEIKLETDCLL